MTERSWHKTCSLFIWAFALYCRIENAAALQGFGLIFDVEPMKGSCGGGTEIHIAGTGFASAEKVLVGGRECDIFVPHTKDGEMLCYTPPGTHGERAEVQVVFSSGHRATWRTGTFRYHNSYTPRIEAVTMSSPILSNLTFNGDLRKELQDDQRLMFAALKEKRNATEVMHVYLGTGLEVMGDKGGKGEFRCDLIETPDQKHGVCQVNGKLIAGYYNFTYTLDDHGTGDGYGKAKWEWGNSFVSVPSFQGGSAGQIYAVEVFPTIHSTSGTRTGQLGGSEVIVRADGLGAQNLASLDQIKVLLHGVPCQVKSVKPAGNYDEVTCETSPVDEQLNFYSFSDQPGLEGSKWKDASKIGIAPGLYDYPAESSTRTFDQATNFMLKHSLSTCGGKTLEIYKGSDAEDCAEACFRMGECRWFFHRPDERECRWCADLNEAGTDVKEVRDKSVRRRRGSWLPQVGGGIYRLEVTGIEYLQQNAQGPTWRLVSATQRCSGSRHWLNNLKQSERLHGSSVQACADACAAMNRANTLTGRCQYFGLYHGHSNRNYVRCLIYLPDTEGCTLIEDNERTWNGKREYSTFELVKPTPHGPVPTGLQPGGRGVFYRVWNACPPGHGFNWGCGNEWDMPFAPLYAALNPEYEAQTPMFEGVRADTLRGPFGFEPNTAKDNLPQNLKAHDQGLVPYITLKDASADHGLVFEVMGFFVAPFTAHYSFMVWGSGHQDLWMSNSEDPADVVLVSEAVRNQHCWNGRSGGFQTLLSCQVFAEQTERNDLRGKHIGTPVTQTYGFSGDSTTTLGPTMRTLSLKAGERRFFVKRVLFPEYGSGADARRRRRHWEGTGVRIHGPDLGSLSEDERKKLGEYRSWPEVLQFERNFEGKCSGTWMLGIPDGAETVWSPPIKCGWHDNDLRYAWNQMELSNGEKCYGCPTKNAYAEVWWVVRRGNRYVAHLTSWQPSGNLNAKAIKIDTSKITSPGYKLQLRTMMDGNAQDLFVYPIPGAFLEVPALTPQVQLFKDGIPARHAPDLSQPVTASELPMPSGGQTGLIPFDYAGFSFDSPDPETRDCSGGPPALQYYRWTIKEIGNPSPDRIGYLRISDLHFWTGTDKSSLVNLQSASLTTNVAVHKDHAETQNALDGNNETMLWLNEKKAEKVELLIDLGSPVSVEMWSITQGDHWKHDARKWLLEGSNDQQTWQMVHNQTEFQDDLTPYGSKTKRAMRGAHMSELGRTTCKPNDSSGCGWGSTFPGKASTSVNSVIGDAEEYPSWNACKQRCCFDPKCVAVTYDSVSKMCQKLQSYLETAIKLSDTSMISNIVSRTPAEDGYGVTKRIVQWEGLQLAAYPGHRALTFCKAQCNANPECNSFAYHATHGCYLKTQCVTAESRLVMGGSPSYSFKTYYKLVPDPLTCYEIHDMPIETTESALKSNTSCSVVQGVDDCGSGSEIKGASKTLEEGLDSDAAVAACCSLCQETKGCTSWHLEDKGKDPFRCTLKKEVKCLRTNPKYISGYLEHLQYFNYGGILTSLINPRPTMRSSLAKNFWPDASATKAMHSLLDFSYLSQQDSPFVSSIQVGGAETTEIAEGDSVTILGGNLDIEDQTALQVMIGDEPCSISAQSADGISFTAPPAVHTTIGLRVLVGWKGYADFAQLGIANSKGRQRRAKPILFGKGKNDVTSISPSAGSVLGGTKLQIEGRGFWPSAKLNKVILSSGGKDVGICEVQTATLTLIECVTDESGSPQDVDVVVNGVSGGTFKYDTAITPIIQEVAPAGLSFAVTGPVTLSGSGLGSSGAPKVFFGSRSCRILESSDSEIKCQLVRSQMTGKPLCTSNKDIYNASCVIKPPKFLIQPKVLVDGVGWADVKSGADLDARFEIHSVSPASGSEKGGAVVTVKGIGFGNAELTSQRMVAALGTFGDVVTWSKTEVVFVTRQVTLNEDKVDLMVNLISAEHKCGVGETDGPCKHGALDYGMTPKVTSLSPTSGRAGQTMQISVELPGGTTVGKQEDVTVHLGDNACPVTKAPQSGKVVSVSCTIPEFDAGKVTVKVRILPLGYAEFENAKHEKYLQSLKVDTISPNQGSIGGRVVTLTGAGFSSNPARHIVRVGQTYYGACDPISSSYSSLTCLMNWRKFDQDDRGDKYEEDVEVTLWDTEVFRDPETAFDSPQTGCLRGEDNWRGGNCLSTGECALRCLLTEGCNSFDYRPRYQDCRLSKKSFTKCKGCSSQRWDDCRYMEKRSEGNPGAAVSVTVKKGFTFLRSLTPDIREIFALPNSARRLQEANSTDPPPTDPGSAWEDTLAAPTNPPDTQPQQQTQSGSAREYLQIEDTGCGATNPDGLDDKNNKCCENNDKGKCSWGEGKCNNNDQCGEGLRCMDYGCSWSFTKVADPIDRNRRRRSIYEDKCCVFQGAHHYQQPAPLWLPGDQLVLRVKHLGVDDQDNNNRADAKVVAAIADPGNGYVKVSVDGVSCPVAAVRDPLHINLRWRSLDVACTLGEVPGGLIQHPIVEVETMGRGVEDDFFVILPLTMTGVTATNIPIEEASLGGGWELSVAGSGFAPAPGKGADSFVQVAVCGKLCEVVSSTYTSVKCLTPNITIPEVFESAEKISTFVTGPRILSFGAGLAGTTKPQCFQGRSDTEFELGHPSCLAAFDGDTELTAGITGSNCQLGLDFGKFANARIEMIRFFPKYDSRDSASYINSKVQVGQLDKSSAPECDELSFGWRGVDYQGCQDTTERGNKCLPWNNHTKTPYYLSSFPELQSHNYCRNPEPLYQKGLWCLVQKGSKQRREYCKAKIPEIKWTDVHTIKAKPKMLWNTVKLKKPLVGRFVRFLGVGGDCRLTEMQVSGHFVAPSSSCDVAVRNVRHLPGQGIKTDVSRPAWQGPAGLHKNGGFLDVATDWVSNGQITFSVDKTPVISTITPSNGTARGGTQLTLAGTNLGADWKRSSDEEESPVIVTLNSYDCKVTEVTDTKVTCVTVPRNKGIFKRSTVVKVKGTGLAIVHAKAFYRYLDRWSDPLTWPDSEPPVDDDLVIVPDGQAVLLDIDTPRLNAFIVQGILVVDDTKDIELHAMYIWVKGGTFEIGTESRPFKHKCTVTLYGDKYEAIRLPVLGAKVFGVSNEQFTIREGGDGAAEEGNIGTLDIHGAPRLKVWTRLAQTVEKGGTTIVLQEDVDWAPGEELVLTATNTPPKEHHGEGLHGAPPVDFDDERVIVESLGSDRRTVTLRTPVKHKHISTSFTRPDGEYIDLSAEVALLTRNVKIQGDERSELWSWGGHTMVAFGGVYRIENAEFYRMGQTGELSRYPIHFHVSQDWGKYCYAKHNSIHHSFQRAVAIHSTDYVVVENNVAFEIIGHMFFVETGMERFNLLVNNIGIGAIPLLSGMLESDQEPAAFWTAAPNNVWRGNIAVTGSDGWYFQLPGHPISHSMDIYSSSICPVHDRIGEWSNNRCHHVTGSCIRVYMSWVPYKDPCNKDSGENSQILFNTTCWGVGFMCYNAMVSGAIHNYHMTSVEVKGGPDVWYGVYERGSSYNGAKEHTDWLGYDLPHVKDSVFVGILPENEATFEKQKWKGCSIEMPQGENFYVASSWWINYRRVPVFMDCSMCWSDGHWRSGAFTYRFKGLTFTNSQKRIYVQKKGIYWDLDGSLVGTKNTYTTWADRHARVPSCTIESAKVQENETFGQPGTFHDSGGEDASESIFHAVQNPKALIHSRRDWSFITCTDPIRKFEVLWPEPARVYLRQMNITNLDTGLKNVYEYEHLELFGWTFPVVANSRVEIQPNLLGLDLSEASIRYGFSDLFALKEVEALQNQQPMQTEWFQLHIASMSNWHHYNLINPDWELVAARRGELKGQKAQGTAKKIEGLVDPAPLDKPQDIPNSCTHGMLDPQHWTVVFKHPDSRKDAPPITEEPWSIRIKAKRCPDAGCTLGLPDLQQEWETFELWSKKFGKLDADSYVEIKAEDWVVFDMDSKVSIKNMTVFGKLSFDDKKDRTLETDHVVVWGLLEIGTKDAPFGKTTAATARMQLRGSVTDNDTYVYIEEETLHNKLFAVPGRVETYGAPLGETWGWLDSSISKGAKSACVRAHVEGNEIDWPAGSQVAWAPTEFDRPAADVEIVTLSKAASFKSDKSCWQIEWKEALKNARFAADIDVGQGKTMSMRAVAVRIDRSVVFESVTTDGENSYGGHFEVFDLPELDPVRVGRMEMNYVQFNQLGKGGLEAAVKLAYQSNFDPPPKNVFTGCSWTGSLDYALHAATSNAPLLVNENTFVNSHNGGIYTDVAVTGAQIVNNAVLGISMSPKAPISTNELTGTQRVIQMAGIRTDELPTRMSGNVVAGSNDFGYLHRLEGCGTLNVFENEAFSVVVGVFLLSQKQGTCQAASLYKVWKAAHVGIYLADVQVPTRLSHMKVADCHLGIVPYFTTKKNFRRLWISDAIIVGSSPGSGDVCSASNFCRTQSASDPWMSGCNSVFAPINFRRVGFVAPLNTGNKKICDSGMDPRQCRLLSPAFPKMACHFPWEYHAHFDRGMGWTFFERTHFAYWKVSDCGKTSRAISMNPSGPEVQFPATFKETVWHETDVDARFELSAERLHDSFKGRKKPCNFEGGGCMGLDQLLLRDADGTLIGGTVSGATHGSVVPLTPRTEIVWSSMCTSELELQEVEKTLDAMVCKDVEIQLVEMQNIDRGAADIKFGPLILNPDDAEDNGFTGGVISSVGPFYGSCPCGWDFSFYHILIKPRVTYYAEVVSLPENFKLRYLSTNPDDSVLLEFFYPDSRGVNVFLGSSKEPDIRLALARRPTLADKHGAHVVDAQALRLYITLRGSQEGFDGQNDITIRRTPTVKLKMNVQISIKEFNGENFQNNIAMLLGVPPERVKVVQVQMRRLQKWVELTDDDLGFVWDDDYSNSSSWVPGTLRGFGHHEWSNKTAMMQTRTAFSKPLRRLQEVEGSEVEIQIAPSESVAAAVSSGQKKEAKSAAALNAQAAELEAVSRKISTAQGDGSLSKKLDVPVEVTEMEVPAGQDATAESETTSEEDVVTPTVLDVMMLASKKSAMKVSADAPCPTDLTVAVTVGGKPGAVSPTAELANSKTGTAPCSDVNAGYTGDVALRCAAGVLTADAEDCKPISCSSGVDVTLGDKTTTVKPKSSLQSGASETQDCGDINPSFGGKASLTCLKGVVTVNADNCAPGCETSMSVEILLDGQSTTWSPSGSMAVGEAVNIGCSTVNSAYGGTVAITCFAGSLSALKDCTEGATDPSTDQLGPVPSPSGGGSDSTAGGGTGTASAASEEEEKEEEGDGSVLIIIIVVVVVVLGGAGAAWYFNKKKKGDNIEKYTPTPTSSNGSTPAQKPMVNPPPEQVARDKIPEPAEDPPQKDDMVVEEAESVIPTPEIDFDKLDHATHQYHLKHQDSGKMKTQLEKDRKLHKHFVEGEQ